MSLRSIFQTRRLGDLAGVAAALAGAPTTQQAVALHQLRLTPDLRLELDGGQVALTGDALGSLLRDQLGLAGAAGRTWRRRLAAAFARAMHWPQVPGRPGTVQFPDSGQVYGPGWVLDRLAEFPPGQVAWPPGHLRVIGALNRRLQAADRPVLVRRVQDTVIAIRSTGYAPLDHEEVVAALRAHGLNRLAWAGLTRRTLDLAVYLDRPALDLGGDRFSAGLHVMNSETGNGRLLISAYLFRWACSNGTIFGVRHRRDFAAEVRTGDRARLVARLHRGVEGALRHLEDYGALVERIRHRAMAPGSFAHLVREVPGRRGPWLPA